MGDMTIGPDDCDECTPALLCESHTIQKLDAENARLREQLESALKPRLDGYRELGARAAAAENERDRLRAKLARVEKLVEEWRRDAVDETTTRVSVLRRAVLMCALALAAALADEEGP